MGNVPMSPEEFSFWQRVRNGEIKLYREETWHDRHPVFSFIILGSITVGIVIFLTCLVDSLIRS
jgi:hypothetical protein